MSLLTYREAYPWTQSIREEILGLRMPPWKAEDGFGSFSNGHVLPAHEMDMLLEWSAGGYPPGSAQPDAARAAAEHGMEPRRADGRDSPPRAVPLRRRHVRNGPVLRAAHRPRDGPVDPRN